MAKKVDLLDFYDSQRAMFRALYTYENNRFKHAIGKCEYWDNGLFSDLHSELYRGIYENCGGMLKGDHIIDEIRRYRKLPSSVTVADYMGAIELKLNAEAMFVASNKIFNLLKKGKVSYNTLLKVCYDAGKSAGNNLRLVKKSICPSDFNTPSVKIKNAKTLVKKYDLGLKLGHLPDDMMLSSHPLPERKIAIEIQRRNAVKSYYELIAELKNHGISDQKTVKALMGFLNQGYYLSSICAYKAVDVEEYSDSIDFHFPRISQQKKNQMLLKDIKEARYYPENDVTNVVDPFRYVCKDDYFKYITEEEIKCISGKYTLATMALKQHPSAKQDELKNIMFFAGQKARELLLATEGLLPEMMNGFYLCFSDIEKLILEEKEITEKIIKPTKTKTSKGNEREL